MNYTHTDDNTLIQSTVLHTRGGRRKTNVRVQQVVSVDHILRAVRKSYKVDTEIDESERVIDAIQHLTKTYPKIMIPLQLLYWMCFGGKRLISPESDKMETFKRRVAACRKKMIEKYDRSFMIKSGMCRGYVDREEHAVEELPKAQKKLVRSWQNANAISNIVGDSDTLKLDSDRKSEIKKITLGIERMGTQMKLLEAPKKG